MKRTFLLLSIVLFMLSSCDVLDQIQEMQTFSKCDFRLSKIKNTSLAGINVQKVKSFSDLNFLDAGRLGLGFANGKLPLSFDLHIEVRNPNQTSAALNKLDWILLIDDIEMLRGVTNQRFEIPSSNTKTLPLKMSFDLMDVLSGKSKDAVLNFGLNLAGASDKPSRITLRAKPSLNVAGQLLTYPDYITIKTQFTSR